jgi:hypothetical protein
VAQVVEHLPSRCKALSSTPQCCPKQKRTKGISIIYQLFSQGTHSHIHIHKAQLSICCVKAVETTRKMAFGVPFPRSLPSHHECQVSVMGGEASNLGCWEQVSWLGSRHTALKYGIWENGRGRLVSLTFSHPSLVKQVIQEFSDLAGCGGACLWSQLLKRERKAEGFRASLGKR